MFFVLISILFSLSSAHATTPSARTCNGVLQQSLDPQIFIEMYQLKLQVLNAQSRTDKLLLEKNFEEKLNDLVSKLNIDKKRLLDFISQIKSPEDLIEFLDSKPNIETAAIASVPMQYGKLPDGKFELKIDNKQIRVRLTYSIEVMTTKVTQKQWVDVFGTNPSHFKDDLEDSESVVVTVNDKKIKMLLNHPVEDITWYSALWFANEQSIKAGLEPAYDFSEAVFDPKTSAADGTLNLLEGKIKINAPNGSIYGNIYKTKGYRLPTRAEQKYIRTNCGKSKNGEWYFDDDEYLQDHGWCANSNVQIERTYPVGLLLPLIIDDTAFYDLYGNTYEWSQDAVYTRTGAVLAGGKNPRLPGGDFRFAVGGHVTTPAYRVINSGEDKVFSPSDRYKFLGLRLVRTLHP